MRAMPGLWGSITRQRAAPQAEMNLAQRPEVAGARASVDEHIRNPRIRRPPGVARGGAALGLPLAPLKSPALRDWEMRVARQGDVPCGARAAEVGGDPPCLVEFRMPAGSAEPWLGAQLQPHSIRRPVRHETQNMPACWPWPPPGRWPAPLTTPAHASGGRPGRPHRLRELRGGSDAPAGLLLVPGVSARNGRCP